MPKTTKIPLTDAHIQAATDPTVRALLAQARRANDHDDAFSLCAALYDAIMYGCRNTAPRTLDADDRRELLRCVFDGDAAALWRHVQEFGVISVPVAFTGEIKLASRICRLGSDRPCVSGVTLDVAAICQTLPDPGDHDRAVEALISRVSAEIRRACTI